MEIAPKKTNVFENEDTSFLRDVEVINREGEIFNTTFSASFGATNEGTLTNQLGDIISDISTSTLLASEEEEKTGLELNEMYGLEEGFKLSDDDIYTIARAKKIKEEQDDYNWEQAVINSSEGHTFANIMGGLAGGIADPVGIALGNYIGNVAMGAKAVAAMRTTKGITLGSLAREAAHAGIGVAVVDVPSYMYSKAKYDQDFKAKELVTMMVGGAIGGAAFSAGVKTIGNVASNLLGKYGDTAGKMIADVEGTTAKLNKLGYDKESAGNFALKVAEGSRLIQKEALPSYSFKPFEPSDKTYVPINSAGETVSVGGKQGNLTGTDNRHLAENAVHSTDNATKGKVAEIDNSNRNIMKTDEQIKYVGDLLELDDEFANHIGFRMADGDFDRLDFDTYATARSEYYDITKEEVLEDIYSELMAQGLDGFVTVRTQAGEQFNQVDYLGNTVPKDAKILDTKDFTDGDTGFKKFTDFKNKEMESLTKESDKLEDMYSKLDNETTKAPEDVLAEAEEQVLYGTKNPEESINEYSEYRDKALAKRKEIEEAISVCKTGVGGNE